jgi:hypothetical protein
MRRAARIDGNQRIVVDAVRVIGASVQSLAGVGNGCLDLLVGYRGMNFIFELKDPNKPPSHRRLTEAQVDWLANWKGQALPVLSANQMIREVLRLSERTQTIGDVARQHLANDRAEGLA